MASPSTLNGEIADRVRAACAATRTTHSELALAIGIPDRTFARLLTGQADWKAVQVAQVARALDVPVSVIWPAEVA